MESWKKSKVVILPTEKASHIFVNKSTKRLHFSYQASISDGFNINQHLYILSNENIKEGDWCIFPNVFNGEIVGYNQPTKAKFDYSSSNYCKKIIATTDESLTIDGFSTQGEEGTYLQEPMPRPSNEFLKKYCELGGIDEVLVEYGRREQGNHRGGSDWLEWLKVSPNNTITIKLVKDSWSREEVILLLDKFVQDLNQRKSGHTVEFKENWIKENL